MSASEPLCYLAGISPACFTWEENLILEIELFTRICEMLKEEFKIKYKDYFRIIKCNAEMENTMMEAKFARCVINDLLSTREYTLAGIACYTQTPEDVIYEIALGLNVSPSATLLRRIIELHRLVRRDLYSTIIKKIAVGYSENK
ncbi:MAG TPA: hypothetical protein VLJ15_03060 [Gammaproteobacteria bacterium]|nr:hypothetical protein [Gammaproteobacteria bacterium]